MRIEMIIEAKEERGRPPAINRLRSALKGLWRGYGVKAITAKQIDESKPAGSRDDKQAKE
jgi:hypothetical protein